MVAGTIGNSRGVLQNMTYYSVREGIEQPLLRLGQLQGFANQSPCLNHFRGLEGSSSAYSFRVLVSL